MKSSAPTSDAELDFSAALTTSATGNDAVGEAQITGTYGLPSLEACSAVGAEKKNQDCFGEKANESESVAYVVPTDAVAYVTIDVDGSSGARAGGSGFYSAYADPLITIDPTFLRNNPGDYLVFSSNVNPSAAIPESSTWTMLLLGFAGLGVAGYRASGRSAARR
jgi:hypothetical protein